MMEFRYNNSGEGKQQPQQQQPMYFAIPNPQPQPQQESLLISEEQINALFNVRLRTQHGNARPLETRILLDGMTEIRSAIQLAEISTGDTGSTERPPITPAFDDVNRGKLQNAYLTLVERYVNYCDHMLGSELKIKTTNEIKK